MNKSEIVLMSLIYEDISQPEYFEKAVAAKVRAYQGDIRNLNIEVQYPHPHVGNLLTALVIGRV